MKKKRLIIGGMAGAVLAVAIAGFVLQEKTISADSYQNKKVTEDTKVKVERFNGIAQDKLSFKAKKPTVIPEGVKELEPKTEVVTRGNKQLTVVKQAWVDKDADKKLKYQQKELLIIQSDDDGTVKPMDILSEGENIQVAGVDAWLIKRGEHNPVQLIFWKDGRYFNVRGMNIEVDQLIKIAESLQ
ncbi:hypothetical protein GFC29_3337 [Anoxybacillus sp. B7M1]|jgi:hypothetical protein|uniref:DUF4367 domain-containing protein n=1 Tax=unclassified Anoxybacillus TaxID=2639704 RepID=UPI0005CD230B|nr:MULTISPECIES: DUF4367 domain-containing protein [unclassified Anoxybacillus]ANB58635.1 hypothetical protein GFC28_2097 [Anoxybacillus sp. B2M1]ANB64641.1 hypothetical protein GFC29_3337 [Anoxybacillus sp. B7M1]